MRVLFLLFTWVFLLHASSLDDLLLNVQNAATNQIKTDKAREEIFKKDFQAAKKELEAIRAELALQKQRTKELKATFEIQKERSIELNKKLQERSVGLKDLFAVAQQEARDLSSMLQGSMTSAQLVGRSAFLDTFAVAHTIPSIDDLSRLWQIYLEEIVASGKVESMEVKKITLGGEEEASHVTRAGIFTAFDTEGFVIFDETLQGFVAIARQPESRFYDSISDFSSAQKGSVVPMTIDPTRGVLFSMLKERATVSQRIEQAGVIGYVILALGVLALLFALGKGVVLFVTDRRVQMQLHKKIADVNNPLGRILSSFEKYQKNDVATIQSKLENAVLGEIPSINSGLAMLKLIAAVAPLLGLLGTVTGMIETFQSITLFGTGDPKLMAGGISQALMTTVLGLVVAIPVLFLHNILQVKSRRIITILTQQSGALVARTLEMNQERTS
ncbi:MAG: MotA/TolQ/ExbB proton channel family protein [Sulfurimonas sp.]|jgi:biopolymer transport protein ExbB